MTTLELKNRLSKSDFFGILQKGLDSVEAIFLTLSLSERVSTKFTLRRHAIFAERYFKQAGKTLDECIDMIRDELSKYLLSENTMKDEIANLSMRINKKTRIMEKVHRELDENENEMERLRGNIEDTKVELDTLKQKTESAENARNTTNIATTIIGIFVPIVGFSGLIADSVLAANVKALHQTYEEHVSHLQSQEELKSNLRRSIHEEKKQILHIESHIIYLEEEIEFARKTINSDRERMNIVASMSNILKEGLTLISRIHAKANVVKIESQVIYDLKIFVKTVIPLGDEILILVPCRVISEQMKQLAIRTENMLESKGNSLGCDFSF
ncbi:hypothetical protein LOD99_8424 [Oopsacas minuta]|uniref:Uncharacterized protein n=1 Tax=Oopsacas minuta TaxID=111878 RepID=A0AAV7JG63_9METZ|nr:hypothetical protein LOD99_8424 [Oopsacas minuta]